MKIESIETFSTRQLSVVRVRTNDGYEGYGQIAPYHANISTLVLHQQIAPHVLGENAENISELVNRCIVAEHKFPGSYVCRAVGGLDTALWDLNGKRQGKSVCELLGGTPRPIPVYGSSMRRDITPEEEALRLKQLQDEFGYRAFKIRIGQSFGNNVDAWPGRTEQIVPAVRNAVGEETRLYVDANSGFTPERAIEVGHMLKQYGVCHYEEPCPYPELEWTKQVRDALDIPVTGGEQDNSMAQWKRMIDMRAVDIVQPDICYAGGICRSMEVAAMADKAGLLCLPHAANLSMVTVFTMHMMASIPNGGQYMEFSIEDTPWTKNLLTSKLSVMNGEVRFPEGAGWGIEVSPEWMEQAEYQISKFAMK